MFPLDLTIAIPIRNEAKNLPGCLAAIGSGFARKIVVIDSGSEDGSQTIARAQGTDIVEFSWDGKFPKKRNWFLRHHPPNTKWILFLDADEVLTAAFKDELQNVLPDSTKAGYWLCYTVHFLGRPLRGGYPLRKLALFRVGAGEYEQIDEDHWSHLDMEVHEHPVLTGEIGTIHSPIDHRDFRDLHHYLAKHNEYSSWEAARCLKNFSHPGQRSVWTWKQHLKYRLARSPLIGPVYFLGSYFLMGGFRDGIRGFAFAILKMAYYTEVYCKIIELEQKSASAKRIDE